MKKLMLLPVWLLLSYSVTHAQFLKKRAKDTTEEVDPMSQGRRVEKDLTIGGDESVTMDSSFEFDVAVYQETVAYQGNGKVVDGGEEIVVYYSNTAPQYCVQLNSKSTGARYHFYVDFSRDAQLSITGVNHISSGEKEKLDLAHMEPVYPGEGGYLNQLMRTGGKKVIAGVACEEYVAQNTNQHPSGTNHSVVTAHVWIPMEPSTLFHGYGLMPDSYKAQIEKMRIEGSYPPVVVPLEMFMQYGNGDKVYTYTTDIIMGEKWKVNIRDINK